MDKKEHQTEVILHFQELFIENLAALAGVDIDVQHSKIEFDKPFSHQDKMATFMDINGSIIGYIAVSCEEKSAASLIDMEASAENRAEYGSFMSELLNSVGGSICSTIEKAHPILTIAAPKLSYGCVEFPQSEICSIYLKTNFGDFNLYYATDSMALKIIDLYEKSEFQKKEIKLILDNVPSALLTFNMDGVIGPESSQTARNLFGDNTAGMKVYDLIFQDPDRNAEMESVMDMLPYSPLPFEESMELAPCDETLTLNNQVYHVIYHYAPIYSKESPDQIEQIMLIVDDITEEVRLKETAKAREEESDFIHKVLKSRESYMSFLSETNENIIDLEKSIHDLADGTVDAAFRASHTIKGNSSIFAIGSLRDAAHHLEGDLMVIRDGQQYPTTEDLKNIHEKFNILKIAYDKHIADAEDLFGDRFDPRRESEQRYEIQESRLKHLMQLTDNPTMLSELEKIKLKRIYIYLAPYEDLIQNLAEKLQKNISPLQLNGESTLIHPERWRSFFSNFVHLIRNSVDHGIETPDERSNTEKPEDATISINVTESDQGVHIELVDDGKGINPKQVADAALKKGIINEQELSELSNREKQMLIFKPGFSTQEEVTTLSGRGVGMDAMRHEVENMGGTLNLDSHPGKGTTFFIFIPYSDDFSIQLSEPSNSRRIFKRVDVPVYLPIERGDGIFGHVINLSPDGFRMVSNRNFSKDENHEVILYLDSNKCKESSVWVNIEIVNHNNLNNGLTEHGCRITSFIRSGDERRFELGLRNLQRHS